MRIQLVMLAAAPFLTGCVGGALTLYEENDVLSVRGRADRFYTQGFRATRVFPRSDTPETALEIAELLPLYDAHATTAIGVVAGQNIYTPKDIEHPAPKDRPYAGWLYGGVLLSNRKLGVARSQDVQETVEIDVGVTGGPSLARQSQTILHRWAGSEAPRGWDNQIQFEPGIVGVYENRHRVAFGDAPFGLQYDLLPSYGASLGNVDTHIAAGGTARLGYHLPRDFGVNTISTTAMETSRVESNGGSFYLFAGAEGRAVLHNLFLDGNTFRDSPSVERTIPVAEFRGGFAIQYDVFRFTYTWITRSPEFRDQHVWTRYGSVSLGVFLDF